MTHLKVHKVFQGNPPKKREVCGRHLNTMHYGYYILRTNSCPKSQTVYRFQYVREGSSGSGTIRGDI